MHRWDGEIVYFWTREALTGNNDESTVEMTKRTRSVGFNNCLNMLCSTKCHFEAGVNSVSTGLLNEECVSQLRRPFCHHKWKHDSSSPVEHGACPTRVYAQIRVVDGRIAYETFVGLKCEHILRLYDDDDNELPTNADKSLVATTPRNDSKRTSVWLIANYSVMNGLLSCWPEIFWSNKATYFD